MPKTVLITGANSGIGYETASHFAKKGDNVLAVCRTEEKAEKTRQSLQSLSSAATIIPYAADLSSQSAIHALASRVKSEHATLDVLINNAGAILPERKLTVDGIEETFAVNHLAYFLLTGLLLPLLAKRPQGRIVSVASEASRINVFDLEDPGLERSYSPIRAYGQSKLMNIMFAFALARRLEGTAITSTAMHPGAVNTNFGKGDFGLFGSLFSLAKPFMRSSEKGAETVIWLADSDDCHGVSGKYFQDKKEMTPIGLAVNRDAQEKLWALSETLTHFNYTASVSS